MAGQRQKPREELAFKRGGRDTVVDLVPEGAGVIGAPPPENMALCQEARDVWAMVVPDLPHVVRREYPKLVRWIFWWNRWWTLAKAVESDGDVEQTQFGSKVSSEFRALERAEAMLIRIESQFGLDPQARMRLGLAAVKTETALEKLRGTRERKPPARMAVAK